MTFNTIKLGDIMNFLIVILRTLAFYIVITIVYRMMGKREVGELGIIDLIVSVLIAELAAMGIENYKENIFIPIAAIFFLVIFQVVMAKVTIKNAKIRDLFEGKPSVIINRGKVNFKEMVKQRYNLDDLLTQLRAQSIKSIEEVDYAILETSGKLSVFKRDDDPDRTYPLPVILDGKVQEDVLIQIRKDISWLNRKLDEENFKLEDIFYGFYQKNRLFLIKRENIK